MYHERSCFAKMGGLLRSLLRKRSLGSSYIHSSLSTTQLINANGLFRNKGRLAEKGSEFSLKQTFVVEE